MAASPSTPAGHHGTQKDLTAPASSGTRSRRSLIAAGAVSLLSAVAACSDDRPGEVSYKPVLYVYPPTEQDLKIMLSYDGDLTTCYPEPELTGKTAVWQVSAAPDGTLRDAGGRTYPSLFWEGRNPAAMTQEEGFIVEAADSLTFLEDSLSLLGLTDREAAELITFWAPRLQARGRSLVTFAGEQQASVARYTLVRPDTGQPVVPDLFLRVYLVIGDVPEHDVPEQVLQPSPDRHGLTLVEWGGTEQ